MKSSYLFLAEGFEEIEALTTVDIMRRAGMDVKTVSITKEKKVTGAHGISVDADLVFCKADFEDAEWLITPGGIPGAPNLHNFGPLCELLEKHFKKGGKIASICASPAMVLYPLGILDGKEATCYPGCEKDLPKVIWRDAPVVALDNLITANGPASSFLFALAIVANSLGEYIARQTGEAMLFYTKPMNYYF